MNCPSLTELCASNAGEALSEHLAGCMRCRALAGHLSPSEPAIEDRVDSAPVEQGREPTATEVWTIWAPHVDEYLVAAVLARDDEEVLVLPLLPVGEWGAEADLQLDQAVLGYPAIAPLWAVDRVLVEQAVEAVDVLSESWTAQLCDAVSAFESGGEILSPVGPEILSDEDPRIDAQVALAEWIRPWFEPRGALRRGEELGPVLAERREELGFATEQLTEEIDVEVKTWRAFEEGRSDPHETIPVRVIARAVRTLQLLPSRRILSLARESVELHNRSVAVGGPRAMARRMQGSTSRRGRDKEAVAKAADDYAEALREALGI